MKQIIISFAVIVLLIPFNLIQAQTPVWTGNGRIAISSDGNEHDHDDWAATPLTLAMLAAKGLQDKMVLYTYSDHVWGSNVDHPTSKSGLNAYQHMRESALGAKKWFGFDQSEFVCAVDNPDAAYDAMAKVINESTKDDPLIIIAAGPMQVVGEGLNRSKKRKRKFVTVISHSRWNNRHSDNPTNKGEVHEGWTWSEMNESFGSKSGGAANFIKILDQNGGDDYDGFRAEKEKFDWVKTSEVRNNNAYKEGAWDWLYTRLETCIKNRGTQFDPSDAGMVVYMLTGIEKTNPSMAKAIMENPVSKE